MINSQLNQREAEVEEKASILSVQEEITHKRTIIGAKRFSSFRRLLGCVASHLTDRIGRLKREGRYQTEELTQGELKNVRGLVINTVKD